MRASQQTMFLDELPSRLLAARDFVEVAIAACELCCSQFDLHQCAITLHSVDGKPLLMVDNIPNVSDEGRLAFLRDTWRHDPMFAAMQQHHAPVGDELITPDELMQLARDRAGYTGATVHTLMLPLIQPGALLGAIRCGRLEPFTGELRRDLTTVSTHVSVRLAQLGITTRIDPLVARLTPRQRDVARLAARGHTNAEIGERLDLSENTVKKHLKDVFELMRVGNRTELATRFSLATEYSVPVGVTRHGELTITRAV